MKGTKSLAKGTDTEMARGGKGPRPKVNNAWPKSHFIQDSYQRGASEISTSLHDLLK